MSVTTSDWASEAPKQPATRAIQSSKVYRREEEFRSALNSHLARYTPTNKGIALRASLRVALEGRPHRDTLFQRLVTT